MRVCFDTNTFLRIFSSAPEYRAIRVALVRRRLTMVVSTEILFEYREVIERRSKFVSWPQFDKLLNSLKALNCVAEVSPGFRFHAIPNDPDDNKFSDCAIAGNADAIITYDAHFRTVADSGYKVVALTPEELAQKL